MPLRISAKMHSEEKDGDRIIPNRSWTLFKERIRLEAGESEILNYRIKKGMVSVEFDIDYDKEYEEEIWGITTKSIQKIYLNFTGNYGVLTINIDTDEGLIINSARIRNE